MSSYLPPSENLPSFNSSVFSSNLTNDEVDSKIKTIELKKVESSNNQYIVSGLNTAGTATGTQTFGVTFDSTPIVVAQIIYDNSPSSRLYQVHVDSINETQFSYSLKYVDSDGVNDASNNFTFIAIGTIT